MVSKIILHHAHKEGFKEREVYEAYKIFFGTLISESRLKIINLLRGGEKGVSEIVDILKLSQPTVSHDLARLKKCGFVKVKTNKNFRYYSLNEKTIWPLMDIIDRHMAEYCIHILHEIKEKFAKVEKSKELPTSLTRTQRTSSLGHSTLEKLKYLKPRDLKNLDGHQEREFLRFPMAKTNYSNFSKRGIKSNGK